MIGVLVLVCVAGNRRSIWPRLICVVGAGPEPFGLTAYDRVGPIRPLWLRPKVPLDTMRITRRRDVRERDGSTFGRIKSAGAAMGSSSRQIPDQPLQGVDLGLEPLHPLCKIGAVLPSFRCLDSVGSPIRGPSDDRVRERDADPFTMAPLDTRAERLVFFGDVKIDLVGNDDVFREFQSGPGVRNVSDQAIRRRAAVIVVDNASQEGLLAGGDATFDVTHGISFLAPMGKQRAGGALALVSVPLLHPLSPAWRPRMPSVTGATA